MTEESVSLLPVGEEGRLLPLNPSNSSGFMTHDRGEYSLYGIPPGRYLVSVGVPYTVGLVAAGRRSPYDVGLLGGWEQSCLPTEIVGKESRDSSTVRPFDRNAPTLIASTTLLQFSAKRSCHQMRSPFRSSAARPSVNCSLRR